MPSTWSLNGLVPPNSWAVNKDRTLTHLYETDEYMAGVEFTAKMFAAGVFYPDSKATDIRSRVANGSVAAQVVVGPHDIRSYRALNKDARFDILIPFSADGKVKPVYDMGYGTVGFTPPFKKAEEGKIRELLALINYLSARSARWSTCRRTSASWARTTPSTPRATRRAPKQAPPMRPAWFRR